MNRTISAGKFSFGGGAKPVLIAAFLVEEAVRFFFAEFSSFAMRSLRLLACRTSLFAALASLLASFRAKRAACSRAFCNFVISCRCRDRLARVV